ncbi:MAG: GNAT family N-acetyltransferase [Mycobacterium sp.]|nr:GNAT family N-acetyltransferase [Mycobacterium sp.]MBV8291309.1 GNAT family N-acetyltransferase [Mycobacterium sp.]
MKGPSRYRADAHDIGPHAAIAELTLVNKGLAPFLFPNVVASLFEREPRCRRIMFDPDHRNTAARRVCEHAGCTFLGEHDMSNRRMALYRCPGHPPTFPELGNRDRGSRGAYGLGCSALAASAAPSPSVSVSLTSHRPSPSVST